MQCFTSNLSFNLQDEILNSPLPPFSNSWKDSISLDISFSANRLLILVHSKFLLSLKNSGIL